MGGLLHCGGAGAVVYTVWFINSKSGIKKKIDAQFGENSSHFCTDGRSGTS